MFKNLLTDERGQGMTEYILVIALIAVVCVVGIKAFGAQIKDLIQKSTRKIKDDTTGFESG